MEIGARRLRHVKFLMSEDCIIVLDDFEGVEKGVVNAMMLRGVLKTIFC